MRTYDHIALEKKWQARWEADGLYRTDDTVSDKENYYILVEFPYPSGNLHIGHWYAFAVPDIFARYLRMTGKNVLFPIGFDSFGLPAENAAIKRGLNPRTWTYDNIAHMTSQLKSMGNSFDWSRRVVTSDPEYYRWTQWLFLKLYEKGLAYKKRGTVPWCDSCKTVLANEQIVNGTCERCGTEVTQKELAQWFLKITQYADRLLEDLDTLPWPEEIKQAQREWIGRSEGANIRFKVAGKSEEIEVFTTRPDTLFGATYMVLAPEHPFVAAWKDDIENWGEVTAYAQGTAAKKELERKEAKEKTGVELKGIRAVNPATKEEIPVWIADYVLASYGTGAVMAVPAHDTRDWMFARKFNLPVVEVVEGGDVAHGAYEGDGVLVHSGACTGTSNLEAKQQITAHVNGTMTCQYRLRDWLLSRQRYWGCPIPIVYDPEGEPHPVPDKYLPWALPDDVDFTPTGEAPLAKSAELKERTEKIFGKGWTPEIDTMDTFIDSSWYFLRYLDPHNDKEFSSRTQQDLWMPVNRYSGGAEHTTMHLLYSRFFHKALHDLGLVADKEPYGERMNRGLILGPDGQKMSKSKGNVIDPDEHVARVGADTVKTYLAFIGPYGEVGQYPWDLGGIAGVRRFLERVWQLRENIGATELPAPAAVLYHQTIKKVTEDIPAFKFNTAISKLMILLSTLEKLSAVPVSVYENLVRLVAPFAPHLAEELWEACGHRTSVHTEAWPAYDASVIERAAVTIVVQVNGKMRGSFIAEPDAEEATLVATAQGLPNVATFLTDVTVARTIVVPGRLVNFVVN